MDSTETAYKLIEAADKCRSEIVLCLLGRPGIGKTEAIERFARDNDRRVVHLIASQILPNEVSGMTMPNQETHTMDVFDHVRLGHMRDGDILFMDELLKGQQQVLNACLTLIQERRMMSGRRLPDVLIVAAANELPSPAQLPLEIRQRFIFVKMEWSSSDWVEYMTRHGYDDRDALEKLAATVEREMDHDSEWNTLTPRTATKLCDWARSVRDGPSYRSVINFIAEAYGLSVSYDVDSVVTSRSDSQSETVNNVMDNIMFAIGRMDSEDLVSDDEYNSVTASVNRVRQTVRKGGNVEVDMADLLSSLMSLREWPKIKEVLETTDISNSIF